MQKNKKLFHEKGMVDRQDKEAVARQRRQGPIDLQVWDGDIAGWKSFKATAKKIKDTYPDKLEQSNKP